MQRIRNGSILFVIFGLLATTLLLPLASNAHIQNNIDFIWHFFAITQAKLALQQGQFPLRYAPTGFDGWPYPVFQFYSTTTYTLAGFIHQWLTADPYLAYKITTWCALVVGGVYFYRLANWLVGSKSAALLASVIYLASPYLIQVITLEGAFNESIALCVTPVVIFYTLRAFYEPAQLLLFLQTSLAWYCLCTIHIITFAGTALFVGLWLVILTISGQRRLLDLAYTASAGSVGLLLAAWYLLPTLLLSPHLNIYQLFNDADYFYRLSPSLTDLLSVVARYSMLPYQLATHPGLAHLVPNNSFDVHQVYRPSVGVLILLAAGVSGYAYCKHKTIPSARSSAIVPSLLILFCLSFLIAWSPINFWRWLPTPFLLFQYSYRLLGQVTWIGSLLAAWTLCWLFRDSLRPKQILLGIACILLASSSWLFVKTAQYPNIAEAIQALTSSDAYLPNLQQQPSLMIDSILLRSAATLSVDEKKHTATFPLDISGVQPKNKLYLAFAGTLPPTKTSQHLVLFAKANHVVVGRFPLQAGRFEWRIPLKSFQATTKNHAMDVTLSLVSTNEKTLPALFPVSSVVLGGFSNEHHLLPVEKVQTHCTPDKGDIICHVFVPPAFTVIELPMPYFRHFLDITLDSEVVPYINILHKNILLAAILPHAGRINTIVIHFQGLLLANFISAALWQIFILLGIYLVLRKWIAERKVRPVS